MTNVVDQAGRIVANRFDFTGVDASFHEHYHESLENVTLADVYEGRRNDILDQRALVKTRAMTQRKIRKLRLAG